MLAAPIAEELLKQKRFPEFAVVLVPSVASERELAAVSLIASSGGLLKREAQCLRDRCDLEIREIVSGFE